MEREWRAASAIARVSICEICDLEFESVDESYFGGICDDCWAEHESELDRFEDFEELEED